MIAARNAEIVRQRSAVQSSHVRQSAASAVGQAMDRPVLLEDRVDYVDRTPNGGSNVAGSDTLVPGSSAFAKGAAGLTDPNRAPENKRDDRDVFLHTDEPAGLFGYDLTFNHSVRVLPMAEE